MFFGPQPIDTLYQYLVGEEYHKTRIGVSCDIVYNFHNKWITVNENAHKRASICTSGQ